MLLQAFSLNREGEAIGIRTGSGQRAFAGKATSSAPPGITLGPAAGDQDSEISSWNWGQTGRNAGGGEPEHATIVDPMCLNLDVAEKNSPAQNQERRPAIACKSSSKDLRCSPHDIACMGLATSGAGRVAKMAISRPFITQILLAF
jgi:hypothetical protein